jgi:hypothetical protein
MWIQRPSCFIDEHSACWSPLEAARVLNWAVRSATENGRGRQSQSRCQKNHTSYNFIYLSHGPFCQRALPARDSPRPSCVRVSHAGSEPVVTPDCPRILRGSSQAEELHDVQIDIHLIRTYEFLAPMADYVLSIFAEVFADT